MALFDFSDPTTMSLLGMLQGLGQASAPSRLPVTNGMVWGALGGGALNAAKEQNTYRLGQSQADLYGAQATEAKRKADVLKTLPDMLTALLTPSTSVATAPPEPLASVMSGTSPGNVAPAASLAPASPGSSSSLGGNWEVRNNNFAGMRIPGSAVGPEAGGFQTFATPEAGIGAISKQLDRYAAGGVTTAMNPSGAPLTTLRGIVTTWAPPNENNTALLIDRAVKNTGFPADQPLNLSDPETKAKVVEAMIRGEQANQLPVSRDVIRKVVGAPIQLAQAAPTTMTDAVPTLTFGGGGLLAGPADAGQPSAPAIAGQGSPITRQQLSGGPPMPAPAPPVALAPQTTQAPPFPATPSPSVSIPGAPLGMPMAGLQAPRAIDPLALARAGIVAQLGGLADILKPLEAYAQPVSGWYRGRDGKLYPETPNTPQYKGQIAGVERAAQEGAAYPFSAALENLKANNTISNELAKNGMQIGPTGQIQPIPGFADVTKTNAAATASGTGEGGLPSKVAESMLTPKPMRPGETLIMPNTGQIIGAAPELRTVIDPVTKREQYTWVTPPVTGVPPGAPAAPLAPALAPGIAKLGPEEEAALRGQGEGRVKAEQAQRQKVIDEADAAQQTLATLSNMHSELGDFTQGPFAAPTQAIARYLRLIDPSWDKQVASYEDFTKNAGTITRQAVREVSGRAAVQEYQMIQNTLPSQDMSPVGVGRVMNELTGLSDYKVVKAQAQAAWEAAHGGPGNVTGFEADFQKKVTPYAFIIARMFPDDRKEMFAKLQASEPGRQQLAKIQTQLQYLKVTGLDQVMH